MAKNSGERDKNQEGVSFAALLLLVVSGSILLAVYVKYVPEGSSALHSANGKATTLRFESPPTMLELESLYYTSHDGSVRDLSVLDECVARNSAESLRKALGIPDHRISVVIRELPVAFCRSVFQQWYNHRSTSSEGFPINWNTLIKALKKAGLSDVAKDVNNILLQ